MARITDEVQSNEGSALGNVTQVALPMEWHFLQCFGQPNAAEMAPNGAFTCHNCASSHSKAQILDCSIELVSVIPEGVLHAQPTLLMNRFCHLTWRPSTVVHIPAHPPLCMLIIA